MPRVKKDERYVDVAYELVCGFKRACALAKDLERILKDDQGLRSAEDDTRGWDGDREAVVVVTYDTLADANRLDPIVRQILSRTVDFTYEPSIRISYGSRGPSSYVVASTTVSLRECQNKEQNETR